MSLRILDTNWVFENATVVSASSSDPLFPPSNLQNSSRGAVWRSTGNFVIGSTNNKIDFQEVMGTNIAATVASGTYTPTTLATAIQTALQAAGVKLYTITYSTSTGKWTILTSNGTFLSFLWLSGPNTSNSIGATLGFAISDQTGALTYTGANIAIHTEESVVFDFQTAVNVDSFAQFFHPTRGVKFTASAVLHLQANPTNTWAAPAVDVVLTINETFQAIANFFGSVQSYRYWRIKIIDPQNPELFVEVSKVSLAQATILSRPPSNAFNIMDLDRTVINETQYGHRYGDVYPVARNLTINFASLSYGDLTTLRTIYKAVGLSSPIVFSFIEFTGQTNQFVNEDFLIYGTFIKNIEGKHKLKGYFDQNFQVQEVS